MALHRFQSGLVDEVRVVQTATGGLRAYLHARADADPSQLQAMQAAFTKTGWMNVPQIDQQRAVLEVRGFKNPKELIAYLNKHQYIGGQVTVTPEAGDKISTKDQIGKLTLPLSGVAYVAGDLGYIYTGVKDYMAHKTNANRINVLAGIGYALGSQMLIWFGGRDQSKEQIRNATREVKSFLGKEQVDLPNDSTIQQVAKEPKRGILGTLDHFFSRYPSEVMNIMYVGVGILLGTAAFRNFRTPQRAEETLKQFNARRLEKGIDMGLGAVTTVSSAAGILVKEKKRDPNEPPKKGLEGVWEWLQEKPLRITGYGLMISTFGHAAASLAAQGGTVQHKQASIGRWVFVVTNIIAELLMAVSSKGHGEGVKADGIDETVLASAADIIARQKPENQSALIHRLAGHMSSSDRLGGKSEHLEAILRKQVDALRNHPWRERSRMAGNIAAVTPALSSEIGKPSTEVSKVQVEAKKEEKVTPVAKDASWKSHALESKQAAEQAKPGVN